MVQNCWVRPEKSSSPFGGLLFFAFLCSTSINGFVVITDKRKTTVGCIKNQFWFLACDIFVWYNIKNKKGVL